MTNAVWLSIFTLTWLIGLTFISSFELKNPPGAGEPLAGSDQPPQFEIFSLEKIPNGGGRDRHAASRETVAMVDGRWSMVAGQCPAADDRTDACSLYDVLHRACAAEDAISKMRRRAACRCNG